MTTHAYRAALLRFADDGTPLYDADGLLVVGPNAQGQAVVHAAGDHAALIGQYPDLPVQDWRGHLIAPGFIDLHLHYPQLDVIGSPADGLLPWLEPVSYTHLTLPTICSV